MGKILVIILGLLIYGILYSLPLWIAVNLICWVFHLHFYLSWVGAYALTLSISILKNTLFPKEDK